MEMPLTASIHDWDTLIEEALSIDQPEGPKLLLAALLGMKNPIICDDEAEQIKLSDAHQADLGPVYHYSISEHPLSEAAWKVWVDRLAWLLQALEACQRQPPSTTTLLVILRVAAAFSSNLSIWERLPSDYLSNNLFSNMARLIGSTQYSVSTNGQPEPIWEREVVDHFLQADAHCDWPEIENMWQTIFPAIEPDHVSAEATACLCAGKEGYRTLALALDMCTSILPIVNVANAMTPLQIGRIVIQVNTNRARFALVQSLTFNQPRHEPFQAETLENLAKVFRHIQEDDAEWLKWMRAFNRYPVRTKLLQPAFGLSLVNSTRETKASYFEAIQLGTTHDECREAVTLGLSEFRKEASHQERQTMWTLVFLLWETWDFGINDANTPLTTVVISDLDFALIGYGVECLSDSALQQKLQKLTTELTTVQSNWYADRTAFDTAWYRALSRWQVFAYAAGVRTGQYKWEIPNKILVPFNPKVDRYASMSLGTNPPYGF